MTLPGTSTKNIATLSLALVILTIQTSVKETSYSVNDGVGLSESMEVGFSIFHHNTKTERSQSPRRGSGLEPAPRFLS